MHLKPYFEKRNVFYGSYAAEYGCVMFIESNLELDGYQLLQMKWVKKKTKLWHFYKTWPYQKQSMNTMQICVP